MREKKRCGWARENELMAHYHDHEWGVPNYDDDTLFEFLLLEGAQAGLSWLTVLKKRENYRKIFANFNAKKIAKFDNKKIASILKDERIIRNRLKVESCVINANAFLAVQKEFGSFADYIWQFVESPIQNKWHELKQVPPRTEISDAMSKDLKKRGFKFVGSTICYAFMQAVGMVNDHTMDCFRHKVVKKRQK